MKYDIYKPAYILLGKYKYRTESGIKINYKDFSFEFIALDEPFLFKIYKEAVNFDIIGCDGNNYILLHPCRLSQIDMALNQTILCRGKFISKGFFVDSD